MLNNSHNKENDPPPLPMNSVSRQNSGNNSNNSRNPSETHQLTNSQSGSTVLACNIESNRTDSSSQNSGSTHKEHSLKPLKPQSEDQSGAKSGPQSGPQSGPKSTPLSHSMEKRKKAGKNSNFFVGFLRSKPSKRKMTFFSVFDLKNPRNFFFFEFLPVFFRFSILCVTLWSLVYLLLKRVLE